MIRELIIASTCLVLATGCDDKKDPAAATETKTEAPKKADAEETAPKDQKKDAHDAFTNHSPDEVEKLLADEGCTPVDANGDATRTKYGTLPGAVLLTSDTKYDLKELPEDKEAKLVFYCGSQACMSAPRAAEVAQKAGYKNVSVMRAGIKGWVKAGKKTDKKDEESEEKAG